MLLLTLSIRVVAQSNQEHGAPFTQIYLPNEYDGGAQIWCATQDSRGVMYFGDWTGVLEFDGKRWTKIANTNNSIVRSLDADKNGRIYVGANNEFGYLQPNEQGVMQYISLSQLLPEEERNFLEIHKTFVTDRGVYFVANRFVFRYFDGKISTISIVGKAFRAFYVNRRLYILQRNTEISELIDTTLTPLPNTLFPNPNIILPYSDDEILIFHSPNDILLYNLQTNNIKQLITQASEYLKSNQLYTAARIDQDRFAIGTRSGGVVVLSNSGDILQIINNERGLPGMIYSLYIDEEKNIWAGTNNGIAKIDYSYPILKFDELQNVKDYVLTSYVYKNQRYIGTVSGLYYLPSYELNSTDDNHKFEKVDKYKAECWDLDEVNGNLIGVGSNGLSVIQVDTVKGIYTLQRPYCFTKNLKFLNSLFIGTNDALEYVRFNDNPTFNNIKVVENFVFPEIKAMVRSLEADANGNLWVGTDTDGAYFIRFTGNSVREYQVTHLNLTHGLRTLHHNYFSIVDDKVYVCNSAGVLSPKFPNQPNASDTLIRFEHSDFWGVNVTQAVNKVIEISDSSYYFGPYVYGYIQNSEFKLDSTVSNRLRNHHDLYLSFIDNSGNISIGSSGAYFYYNINSKRNLSKPFDAIIRKVTLDPDSLLFGGCYFFEYQGTVTTSLAQPATFIPTLDYGNNSLTIEFSALFFEEPQRTQFKYYLEGFSKQWTNWNTENKAVFTNLSEGTYIFKVRAKNVYGVESNLAEYTFRVLPPWYRTWWAVLIYLVLLATFIIIIVKVYTLRLVKQKEYLEQVVKERTAEISAQKEEIQAHNKVLHQKNVKIEYQSNQIIASINYAKRIQEAVLPDINNLAKVLPPHFILFRPRDIVSGDFYWTKYFSNYLYFAVADCTGHGVPGAFMSMLGTAFLNEITGQGQILTPAEILDLLREKVKKSLHQVGKEGEAKDGMDISLIRIDTNTNELVFAGAYNSLIHIRQVDQEPVVTRLKGDRMPIGISIRETEFTNQNLVLKTDDMLYLHSDGFVDQYGGDDEKKFMSKNFVELLQKNYHLSATEQKEVLESTLDNWIGLGEQIDDILVVGICYKEGY
jgi:serine phosphatase RsbU (regulator of sigma subunit)